MMSNLNYKIYSKIKAIQGIRKKKLELELLENKRIFELNLLYDLKEKTYVRPS